MLNTPNPHEADYFGQELVLNLYDCNAKTIASGPAIKKFVYELCDRVIHMKRFGRPLIPHFGHDNPITSGYSLVQLIETSSVTAHFLSTNGVSISISFPARGLMQKKQNNFAKSSLALGGRPPNS